jgi:hypothetical protein
MPNPFVPIRFVCLANSVKLGGRCIAGIELDNQNNPRIQLDHPKWIRPISEMVHGEVNIDLVSHINLLDIVELEITDYPEESSYQSENAYFNQYSINRIGNLDMDLLDDICSQQSLIFENKGKAVSKDVINDLSYSLMLIKTDQFKLQILDWKLRIIFLYAGHEYDLPITDPSFIIAYEKNKDLLKNIDYLYLCISLAVEHNGWHSKLIAGIIY